jgi:uncharacterized protein YerC
MPFEGEDIVLASATRSDLEEIARSQSLPAGFVLRAKIILLLAEGLSYEAIETKLDTTAPTISRWKKRFLASGLDGFETQRAVQPPQKLTAKLRGKILEATRRRPQRRLNTLVVPQTGRRAVFGLLAGRSQNLSSQCWRQQHGFLSRMVGVQAFQASVYKALFPARNRRPGGLQALFDHRVSQALGPKSESVWLEI